MSPITPTSRAIDRLKSYYDVAVIGAGPAGIAAASVASRAASVLLLEATDRLGGSVTAAMHRCMCGLYASLPTDPLQTLNDFTQRDVIRRMLAEAPDQIIPRQLGKAPVLEFPRAVWESCLSDICSESNADLALSHRLTNIRRDQNHIAAIEISPLSPSSGIPGEGRGGGPITEPTWIPIKLLIDCTGSGHALKLAGQDAHHPPNPQMLGGFSIRLTKISADPELLRLQIPFALAKAVDADELPALARFTAFYPGPAPGEGICKLAVDPAEYSSAQADEFANQVIRYLVREIEGLHTAKIAEKSPRILPRDGLRLRGRYTVTQQDILQPRRHGTDSVHAWWPIEKWDISTGPTYAYPPPGQPYDIPPDALRSDSIDNLLAAGTCISATSDAAASTRASGICLATGDAAGRLALSLLKSRD